MRTLKSAPWAQSDSRPIRADGLSNGVRNFEGKARPILGASAVFVRPMVAHILSKLVYEIPIGSWQFKLE